MSTPIVVQVARVSRRGVVAAVALALSLACLVLAVAASSTPMTDMVIAPSASATTSSPATAGEDLILGPISGGVGEVVRGTTSPVPWSMSPPMASMCDTACWTNVSGVCAAAAAGLTLITMLGLLWASRRDTFIGLLARAQPRALARRRQLQPPWTVLSPISLCVLRV